ncbi:MAG TPA: ABC transporter ATP-binding protein [Aliidongia sp.]|uniref:ABC transporter ATP-binding protein n=1 Tax=Aliidongia sp. TaxID=1914230 RepID=UPI002DDD21A2|nr:ABC transporter ATP-binding protein [Aliidongia sp.]HEV2674830.1 ABC transporter ATP-binding protein [Aliidongia sp.]
MTHPSVRESEPWRDASAEAHIRIDRLVKIFGDTRAVDGVSLGIHRGELFSLLGGSGCGKTTLLRMLAGFVTPDAGSIVIDGQDVSRVPPYERPVNMMFQSYALFPHMTVEDNVAFGLRRDGVGKDEIRRRVGEALDLVQLGPLARRKPGQLSGGQRQRVALARSIIKRPKVLLLDEPLSALDKKLREATQYELRLIQEQVGITFVMVTHDQEEAMTMSTRIAVMDHGKIVQVGKPNEIYEFPTNRFVADFIGSVNLFDGHLKEDFNDHAVVECAAAGADLVVGHAAAYSPGAALCIAVRPEKLTLVKPGEGLDLPNRLAGRIRDVAYLGDGCVYHVILDSGKVVKATAPNVGRWDDQPFGRDEPVWVCWSAAASILVDP